MARPRITMAQPGPGNGMSTMPSATTRPPNTPIAILRVRRPVGLARILSSTPTREVRSSGFVVISSPSVPAPRHYPGGMDVTGVSQLLDHPTPGGPEYLGRTGQDNALPLVL